MQAVVAAEQGELRHVPAALHHPRAADHVDPTGAGRAHSPAAAPEPGGAGIAWRRIAPSILQTVDEDGVRQALFAQIGAGLRIKNGPGTGAGWAESGRAYRRRAALGK